nr:xyloglucan galactosyltransferase MUR3 [Ipomoea batatas]
MFDRPANLMIIRRRSPTLLTSNERVEKAVGRNLNSRLFTLALLSAIFSVFFWCFHFAIERSNHNRVTESESDRLASVSPEIRLLNSPEIQRPKVGGFGSRKVNPGSGELDSVIDSGKFPFIRALTTSLENKSDPCGGRYVYVHNLPPRFNEDILKECEKLSPWMDMCKFMANGGLGPPLENAGGVLSETGWYATDQFALEVIFTNRMKQYECLTNDSSLAAAIFVPFFAGLEVSRHLWGYNISVRDAAALDLVKWLEKTPEWRIMGGKDHFLVAGRITWDFRRLTDQESDWGNNLLLLPAAKNMTTLVVESSPWNSNDFGIPYPTYFHPSKDSELFSWQDRMRKKKRKWLFSFAGAPRPGNPRSIRGHIIQQCRNSKVCRLFKCDYGESSCHSPSNIMQMFQESVFCLQPQGDSYTRRSAFDAMLAGCIPVFFHPGSAYIQYTWYLPRNHSSFSVFIPEADIRRGNASIEERLSQVSPEQVEGMRESVIALIPRLIYSNPRARLESVKDAFDVAVQGVIDKVTKLRRDIVAGRGDEHFVEELSWKYALMEEGQHGIGAHEWDPYFSQSKDYNDSSVADSDSSAQVI